MIKKLPNGELDLNVLEIKDVIDIKLLQTFQDNFATALTMSSVTVDKDGIAVTKPSSYTRACLSFTQSTKIGHDRCALSHKKCGEEATKTDKPYIHTCHAGLLDFAAPISVGDYHIGSILGGQVFTAAPSEAEFRKTANEIGVNEDDYVKAINEIHITHEKNVIAAAEVLSIVTNSLSQAGYEKLKLSIMSQTLADNFSQISATMEELSASSITVTNNQHNLSEEIINVKNISIDINSILDSIKSIADQTKMLGLNAAIEAARAGDAGKGFGVVATEIRALSQNSKETAVKILSLTNKIQNSVDKTIETSHATLETTEQQSAAIQEVTSTLMEVTTLADELNAMANDN